MIPLPWRWLWRNFNLVLLLAAITCLALALGKVVRGVTWSLLVPISLFAVACGWGAGASRLNPKQAWLSLTGLGIPGVFIHVTGLVRPLGGLILAVFSLMLQIALWFYDRVLIDVSPVLAAWTNLTGHVASILARLWEWSVALVAGKTVLDPLAAGLVWSLLLWLVGAWAGWQLRRTCRALVALTPGGVVLALVLDYTRGETGLVIVYLTILLALMGLSRNVWMHLQWQRRRVDFAKSIVFDTLLMVGLVTVLLVLAAAGAPSFSWRELLDKLQEANQNVEDRVAESLGLEAPPNVAIEAVYRAEGLPRQHLLDIPPERLQDVVLTISTGELPPLPEAVVGLYPARYYWRAITYDVYSGVGWRSSPAVAVLLPANTPLLELSPEYRRVTQHIERRPGAGSSLYWTGLLAQANTELEIAWRTKPPANPDPVQTGDMLGALTDSEEYTVVSYVPQFSAARFRRAGGDYPAEIISRYLQLPESTPERVLALARELTQADPTPYDRAESIEAYLRGFPYTLEVKPPPQGRDVVDYFLFTARQGYCDYYATAMVVLARAAGLPARVVVGYASGEYDAPTAKYIIREKDAHSWVEVYFSGIGWVEFEPTAALPVIPRSGDENASETPPNLPAGQSAIAWLKTQWRDLVSSLAGQAFIAGSALIVLFFLWQMGEMWFLYLIPAPQAIAQIYSRLEKVSTRVLPDLPAGHTPCQLQTALAHRLRGIKGRLLKDVFSKADLAIERIVALYVAQAFSGHPPSRSQVNRGIRTWIHLRWRLWLATSSKIHPRSGN